ncbi:glycosyltransferase [Clostridium sp. CH2]|uniref:glycosyltransferase n=1 Tax=Clostridium sp. CH2 TaxID=2949990 RepID=UPI00207A09E8|nr:glycosyltransferase [Clostridium sp. CH2]
MKLSIAMIVKNEEKNIERTLIPLKKLSNYISTEIIIVDTGSTDRTIEISKKYTNKIYFHKWNDNFAEMRNISINYCSGEWILVVDADEVLYDIEQLISLLNSSKLDEFYTATINIIDFTRDIENSIKNGDISLIPRLFKNDEVTYTGIVHEQPQIKGSLFSSNIRFIHYGYDNNDYKLMQYKIKRNLNLLFEMLKKDPNATYILYQISATYHMNKDISEALTYIKEAYKISKIKNNISLNILKKYCDILYQSKSYKKLKEISLEGIKNSNESLDFFLFLGEANYHLGEYEKAVKAYERCLDLNSKIYNEGLVSDINVCISTRHAIDNIIYNMGMSYYQLGMKSDALNNVLKIKDKSIIKENISMFIRIIFDTKQWDKFVIVEKYIDKYNYENILNFIQQEITLKDIECIDEMYYTGKFCELLGFVKYFKQNNNINKKIESELKIIINKNNIIYSVYTYYLLKIDVNNIKEIIKHGKDKLEVVLSNLCSIYYDLNEVLFEFISNYRNLNLENSIINIVIEKALLAGQNLNNTDSEKIFLNYIAERYYIIIKMYSNEILKGDLWIIPQEDKFIIQLKNILSYKYDNTLKYVKALNNELELIKLYSNYIKILSVDVEDDINIEIKAMIPQLVCNIEELLKVEKYDEAYNIIEESLKLIKFDFDIMVCKLKLLLKFNYSYEALQCLKKIILYGDIDKVNELLIEYF